MLIGYLHETRRVPNTKQILAPMSEGGANVRKKARLSWTPFLKHRKENQVNPNKGSKASCFNRNSTEMAAHN